MLTCSHSMSQSRFDNSIEWNASHKVDTPRFAGEVVSCLSLHYGKQTWLQWETFDEIYCFIILVASLHTQQCGTTAGTRLTHPLLVWRVFQSWPGLCQYWIPQFFHCILLKSINPFEVSNIFSTVSVKVCKRENLYAFISMSTSNSFDGLAMSVDSYSSH